MDIWKRARDKIERGDLETAWSLGFESCQICNEWFSLSNEGWEDCVECGRHCPSCAESTGWEWCEGCGFTYCHSCIDDAGSFRCDVCMIAS